MMEVFTLNEGFTTRQINDTIRDIQARKIKAFTQTHLRVPSHTRTSNALFTHKGERRYVFGVRHDLRDTLIAHYVVGSGELVLCMPANYKGWDRSDAWDQLRISIRDEILYRTKLINRSIPSHDVYTRVGGKPRP